MSTKREPNRICKVHNDGPSNVAKNKINCECKICTHWKAVRKAKRATWHKANKTSGAAIGGASNHKTCHFPDRTPGGGYKKGCRCPRCKGHVSTGSKKYWEKSKETQGLKNKERRDNYTDEQKLQIRWNSFLRKYDEVSEEAKEEYKNIVRTAKKCEVCKTAFKSKTGIQVDHCHDTGKIRGALCRCCNQAEGHIRNLKNAQELVKYLKKNS